MGRIRNHDQTIEVVYEPDEIISEKVGFRENTVASIGSAIIYAAGLRLKGTPLEGVSIRTATLKFKGGKFVVTMQKG